MNQTITLSTYPVVYCIQISASLGFSLFLFQFLIDPHVVFNAPTYVGQ